MNEKTLLTAIIIFILTTAILIAAYTLIDSIAVKGEWRGYHYVLSPLPFLLTSRALFFLDGLKDQYPIGDQDSPLRNELYKSGSYSIWAFGFLLVGFSLFVLMIYIFTFTETEFGDFF